MKRTVFVLVAALAIPATAVAARKDNAVAVAPAFRLPTRSGIVDSDSLRGKVVVVDFWASWCAPCQRSFPWMNSLVTKFSGRGLAIVAINLDKQRDLANDFLSRQPASFLVAFDPAGSSAEAFHVEAMPTTFLISRDGHVLTHHAGYDSKKAASFEHEIEEALQP